MSISIQATQSGATIFDVPADEPRTAIAEALERTGEAHRQYRRSKDMLDAGALLDEIEGLRRFVLVRATLARCLSERPAQRAVPLGRELCEALEGMIGDVPSLVEACSRNGEYRMERDTRRAIACLFFLGSLDPQFL
jgi:hypothetical protein